MPRETDSNLRAVTYWPTDERIVRPGRVRWRKDEHVRVLSTDIDTPPGVVAVVAAHRDFPRLGFRLDLDRDGDLVGFSMAGLVEITDGAITSYTLGRHPGAPHLTARRVREVPVGTLHDAAQKAAMRAGGLLGATVTDTSWATVFHESRRPGRRGRPDRYYAELAAEYVGQLDTGRPVAALAEQRHVSRSQMSNLLAEARSKGVLTHPGQGRGRGSLTDYGVSLLRDTNTTDQEEG